ncbi:MAG: biotin synthase BioB [Victivallaceae bacterium]|nr:biotin synthase BioB [Victivallaceae bacterium]
MRVNPAIEVACKVLDGKELSRSEALDIANLVNGADILDLVSLANKVRQKFAGKKFGACSIINAKSGLCSENCRFCSQSASHPCDIETYPLLAKEEVLAAARKAFESGVTAFGYVTSGYGYPEPNEEFNRILETLDLLHSELPALKICVCIGILGPETAKMLAAHHAWRYNMNLQTNPARYAELIADTHTIEAKIKTIEYLQAAGVTNCTGGIIGLGESWEDRVDMALAIRKLDVEGSPINILLPIPGTPLENQPHVTPAEAAKTFALFRLINPAKMMKFAAGRETMMKDFQGLLMLSGLNSIITGGYLTTRGRSVEDDRRMLDLLEEF